MGVVMQVSFTASIDTDRAQYTIGRVAAHTIWRCAERQLGELDRQTAMQALINEAAEYGADGLVEIAYAVEECRGSECESLKMHRLVATGRAVKLSIAA